MSNRLAHFLRRSAGPVTAALVLVAAPAAWGQEIVVPAPPAVPELPAPPADPAASDAQQAADAPAAAAEEQPGSVPAPAAAGGPSIAGEAAIAGAALDGPGAGAGLVEPAPVPEPDPGPDPSVHRSSQPRFELGAKLVAKSLLRAGGHARRPCMAAQLDDDDDDGEGCMEHERHRADSDGGAEGFAGVGLLMRLRPSHFVAAQLDLELLKDLDPDGDSARQILALEASLLVYFAHTERFELYGSFGMGSAAACWSVDEDDCEYGKGSAFGIHTGLGAQFVVTRHLRLFGEVRGQVLAPLHHEEVKVEDRSASEQQPTYYLRNPAAESRIVRDVEPGGPFFVPSISFGGTFGF